MVGRVQREDAVQYLRDVVGRAAQEAVRAMADVLAQEEFTRCDAELLREVLLRDAQWTARDTAYTPTRLWKEDPAGYAMAFAWVAATILALDRAQQK